MAELKKYVAYYRVSTEDQQKSGLGLEAQKEAVRQFTKFCTDCIIAEFTEKENSSGKNDKRVELLKAVELAKQNNAILLVSKIDRLSRNAAFIMKFKEANVDFVCCDMPDRTTITTGVFASIAQYEREMISDRTKAALQVKKAQGFKLGNPQGFNGIQKAIATRRANAESNLQTVQTQKIKKCIKDTIKLSIFEKESVSLSILANQLNDSSFRTLSRDAKFTAQNVVPILKVVLKEMNLDKLPKFQTQTQN